MFQRALKVALGSIGIQVNGPNPWDPQAKDSRVLVDIARGGSLAAGETYMAERWDVEQLDELVARLQKHHLLLDPILFGGLLFKKIKSKFFNLQRGERAFEVGQVHYDLGNDLYQAMLDTRMIYTAAYWKDATTLDEAQEAKLDLICRKLGLKTGDRLLDIGCGWGGLMKYAAEKYGVSCVGLSVSKEQTEYGRTVCVGLPIEFVIADYAEFAPTELFDHVASIEMFEAVGHKNYGFFMKKVSTWLKPQGRFLLQTISSTLTKTIADPWIDTYIFPNGILPTKGLIEKSIKGNFVAHDWHDIGLDYDKTLMAWWHNFSTKYPSLDRTKYDRRFYRMWQYYLLTCAGSFRSQHHADWQILLTKPGVADTPLIIR
jgi:cyclopropane-fatty-acyl-phospholipid synthase